MKSLVCCALLSGERHSIDKFTIAIIIIVDAREGGGGEEGKGANRMNTNEAILIKIIIYLRLLFSILLFWFYFLVPYCSLSLSFSLLSCAPLLMRGSALPCSGSLDIQSPSAWQQQL